jgi:hypothetical protein
MRSPRVKRLATIIPPLHDIGTLNPEALSSPVLVRPSVRAQFDTVASLSATIAALKADHDSLQTNLSQLINSDEQTRFTKFKKDEIEFSRKLAKREAEIEEFGRFLDRYRMNARPTFVEVDASAIGKSRKTTYDLISASLLVSNDQRGFFTKGDIERQNHELRSLIDQQEETLRLLDARLKLFNSFQQAHTAEHTLNSLRRGYPPLSLASEAPTISTELRTKLNVLANELAQLVSERKELTDRRIAEKLKLRKRRLSSEGNSVSDEDLQNSAARSWDHPKPPSTANQTSSEASIIDQESVADASSTEASSRDEILSGRADLPESHEITATVQSEAGDLADRKQDVQGPIATEANDDGIQSEEPQGDSIHLIEQHGDEDLEGNSTLQQELPDGENLDRSSIDEMASPEVNDEAEVDSAAQVEVPKEEKANGESEIDSAAQDVEVSSPPADSGEVPEAQPVAEPSGDTDDS